MHVLKSSVPQQELFGDGEEAVVSGGIEVGFVGAVASLEVDLAELLVCGKDIAVAGGIEHGDSVGAADIEHGIHDLLAQTAHEILACPRGEEEDFGTRVFRYEAAAEDAETLSEHIDADGVYASRNGIVVTGNDDDIVQRVLHFGVALVHGGPPPLEVQGYAVAITPVVEVLHLVFLGELIVPGVLHRLTVVAHIAVADDTELFALQGVCLRGTERCNQAQGAET